MTRLTPAELWTSIIRWDYLAPGLIRVRVPCGARDRAKWLQKRLGGYVKAGSVAAGGTAIGPLLRGLGQPKEVIALAEAYGRARGEEAKRAAVARLWAFLGLETRPRATRL